MEQAEQPQRRRAGFGVAGRIWILALVPVIGAGMCLGLLAQASRERLAASRELTAQITMMRDLAELHRSLTVERLVNVALVRLRQWNIDDRILTDRFGVDAGDTLENVDRNIERGFAALGPRRKIDTLAMTEELGQLRQLVARADADPAELAGRYGTLVSAIGAAIDFEMMNGTAPRASLSPAVGASLARMMGSVEAYRFGALQILRLSDVWFADPADLQHEVIALATDNGQYERAMEALLASRHPAIDSWAVVLDSPDVQAFHEAVAEAIRGDAVIDARNLDRLVAAFGGAGIRQDALGDLIDILADEAEAQARQAHDATMSNVRELAFVGLGVAAVTLALAAWSARSITRPLRRLVARAVQIRDGDLSPNALTVSGPHDLAFAATTLEQLVDNLRLLDAKSAALSRNDLDDPVLEQDLPGRLGTALQQSAVVLRESISARDELQQRLWYAARHDSLTRLANRPAVIDALRDALVGEHADGSLAVLFVDLDDFKRVNDVYGHAVGDEVLRITANRMRSIVRASDVVGRLGGDEFMVVLFGIGRDEGVLAQARRLREVIRRPIELAGTDVGVGASVGVAFATPGEVASDLLARADLAVYQAKQHGTGVHVYDEELHRAIQTRTTIEKDLALALARSGELELHYQPIVDAYTRDVRRVEALLRWTRPGHGAVPPEVFVRAAESSSLIIDVDQWVLQRAIEQLVQWSDAAPVADAVGVAINISGRHLLSDSFVPTVREIVLSTGVEPTLVTIELTESVLLDDLDRAARHLAAVRDLGVHVHVDDFGTGYTSIAHLHALPIDGIKIDRRFIGALPGTRELTLVRTLVELGLQLGLCVVAEGVETEEQLTIVQSLGCDAVQGYLVGEPAPAATLLVSQLPFW